MAADFDDFSSTIELKIEREIRGALSMGACCLDDFSCLFVSEEECALLAQAIMGLYLGAGVSCGPPNPCLQLNSPIGACCVGGICIQTTEVLCMAMFAGTYQGDGASCDSAICPEPTDVPSGSNTGLAILVLLFGVLLLGRLSPRI